MGLDGSLRIASRDFSTFFLVALVVLLPLHVIYGWWFQDVLAVRELHGAIADFPPSRQVRGVGQADVERARLLFWVLALVEIALLPVIARAYRRVIDLVEGGEIPTVAGAWSGPRDRTKPARAPMAMIVGAVCLGVLVAVVAEVALREAADLAPNGAAFAAHALAAAAARSMGIPFLLVPLIAETGTEAATEEVPDLY